MKKETYEIAELDIIVFKSEDIITTSDEFDPEGEFEPDPNEGNPVGG